MEKRYVLQDATKSHCPRCGTPPHLLIPDDAAGPPFFICFGCSYVGQVGGGPVRKTT